MIIVTIRLRAATCLFIFLHVRSNGKLHLASSTMKTRNPLTITGTGRQGEKKGCVYASVVYMQTVNPALYPGEGALWCSAIVNFARGEIPRPFLQKPRAIRPRSSARGTFRRKSRKEKRMIGPCARERGNRQCEKEKERENVEKRPPDSSVNLFYADLAALFDSHQVAIVAKIASSCHNVNGRACVNFFTDVVILKQPFNNM